MIDHFTFDAQTVTHNLPRLLGIIMEHDSRVLFEAPGIYSGIQMKYTISGSRSKNYDPDGGLNPSGWTVTEDFEYEKEVTVSRVPLKRDETIEDIYRVDTDMIEAFYLVPPSSEDDECSMVMDQVHTVRHGSRSGEIHDPKKPGIEILPRILESFSGEELGTGSSTRTQSDGEGGTQGVEDWNIIGSVSIMAPYFFDKARSDGSVSGPGPPHFLSNPTWGVDGAGGFVGVDTSGWSASEWRDLSSLGTVKADYEEEVEDVEDPTWDTNNVKHEWEWSIT